MLLTSKIKITNHKHRQRHKTCTTVGEGTAHVSSRHTSGQSYEHEPHNVTKRPACLTHFSIRLLRSVYYKRLSCASKLITRQLAVPISPSDSARRSKVSPYTVWLTPKLVLTPCHLKKMVNRNRGRPTDMTADILLSHACNVYNVGRCSRCPPTSVQQRSLEQAQHSRPASRYRGPGRRRPMHQSAKHLSTTTDAITVLQVSVQLFTAIQPRTAGAQP